MRRPVPPSLMGSDPLEGREWEGYSFGEYLVIDDEVYRFYKHEPQHRKVKLEEPHTGILWWFDETYFLVHTQSMEYRVDSMMAYTPNPDNKEEVIRKRRQAARERYMESVAMRDGRNECQALTKMANHWWPNTNLTRWEQ